MIVLSFLQVSKFRTGSSNQSANKTISLKIDLEVFTGFKSAIEACYLDWDDYPMPGITYTNDLNPMYHCPFTCFRHSGDNQENVSQVCQFVFSSFSELILFQIQLLEFCELF